MLENEIEKRLVYEVKQRGGLCLKLALEGLRGFPDRTVIWPDWYFNQSSDPPDSYAIHFIELKKPGGKLSKQQEKWIKDLKATGCDVFVIASMEDVDTYIEENS